MDFYANHLQGIEHKGRDFSQGSYNHQSCLLTHYNCRSKQPQYRH
jgi:hypothetical protein